MGSDWLFTAKNNDVRREIFICMESFHRLTQQIKSLIPIRSSTHRPKQDHLAILRNIQYISCQTLIERTISAKIHSVGNNANISSRKKRTRTCGLSQPAARCNDMHRIWIIFSLSTINPPRNVKSRTLIQFGAIMTTCLIAHTVKWNMATTCKWPRVMKQPYHRCFDLF